MPARTMTDSQPSFAIMGSGGVGGYFGARLAQAGYRCTFIARGAHLAALRRRGLRIDGPDEDFTIAPCTATDRPEDIGPVDFVLFTVKLWDTESAGAACRPLLGPGAALVSLQNGVDSEPLLCELLGREQVMGGVAQISATISEPGRVTRLSPFASLRVGELDGGISARGKRLAAALADAGLEVELSADIQRALWKKFMFLTGISALTALTRQPVGRIREDPDTRALLVEVMAEVLAVATAKGIGLSEQDLSGSLRFIDTLPAAMRASMAMDLERGNRLELDGLSGAVVRLGRELGLETPANRFICTALKLSAAP